MNGLGREACIANFKEQVDVFVKNDVDLLLGEVGFLVHGVAKRLGSNLSHRRGLSTGSPL